MLETLKRKRSEEGFTLIELLIVIIILAILAVIVIFAVGSTTKNAAIAACKSTVKTVETAIESYKAQVGTFPTAFATLTGTTVVTGNTVGPWLRTKPVTSTSQSKYYYLSLATTGKVTVNYKSGTTGYVTGTADATSNPCTKA